MTNCNHDWQLGTNGYTCRKCFNSFLVSCENIGCLCKCHQPQEVAPQKEWEEEVDNLFVQGNLKFQGLGSLTPESLKDFISNLLISQKSQLIKEIEGLKNPNPQSIIGETYAEAIDDAVKIIKGELN